MASATDEVVIKKEIEDTESPEQVDNQDSSQNQSEQSSSAKASKVWLEDETRSLIALAKHYIPKFKDSNYTKRQLLEDISNELHLIGYDATLEHVRNKLKYLRTKYRSTIEYNNKHVIKRTMPFSEELSDLYSLDYFDDQDSLNASELNGNGSSDRFNNTNSKAQKKSSKSVPASHVDLGTVVTTKKRTQSQKSSRSPAKKKATAKNQRSQPLFQCGLCMQKFSTSNDMHGHDCKHVGKITENSKKKLNSSAASTVFHWNSLITMHFLELLREYQHSNKNSNFRKGNIWENMSLLMKRRGHTIEPKELEKKFHVLTSAFEKTMKYNKTHKDKKKCAFFKRLTELYSHPSSFKCFKSSGPYKMTVEVSPFSYATKREPSTVTSRSSSSNSNNQRKVTDTKQAPPQNGTSEILQWLQNTWNEWKEIEKKREEVMAKRHNDLMEMLSYLIDSNGDNAH
ncbi:uncharacterized protein [Parasteatoda tepidariorum]|uniref:uncharacterized protein n=1 Tax=Parasteatoda tepidariorum TaxID=114398 RepID=UPI00077F8B4C|nr:uncharacterized protein LOC107447014 isoform X1 [Parasteatoda tepidariorum]